MLEVGAVIGGKFRIERIVGAGGMGVVAVAVHEQLDQRVAVKVLHDHLASDDVVVERMLREARAVAKLRSEHACRVSDFGRLDSGAPYFAMELLDGRDLARVLASGPLATATAVGYVVQACVAIAEAHGQGIVHRDLKPANLFVAKRLDGSPLIKVLDFGIAKAPGRSAAITQTDSVMGTPGYMAPEQFRSSRDVDARADIWALGVILYEAISGRVPFPATSLAEAAIKIATEEPEPIDVADELRAIVLRCLAKEPGERFDDVGALARALAPFGGPSAARDAELASALVRPRELEDTMPSGADATTVATAMPAVVGEAVPTPPPRVRPRMWIVGAGVIAVAAGAFAWLHKTAPSPAVQSAAVSTSVTPPAAPIAQQPSAAEPSAQQPSAEQPSAPQPEAATHERSPLDQATEAAQASEWGEALRFARQAIAAAPSDVAYRIATYAACMLPDASAAHEYARKLTPRSFEQIVVFCRRSSVPIDADAPAGARTTVDREDPAMLQRFHDAIATHHCELAGVLRHNFPHNTELAREVKTCEGARDAALARPGERDSEAWLIADVEDLGSEGQLDLATQELNKFYAARAIFACAHHDELTARVSYRKVMDPAARGPVEAECKGIDLASP
jgi:tRNA A-37 threonylcarbamoyl transferase component Bud32